MEIENIKSKKSLYDFLMNHSYGSTSYFIENYFKKIFPFFYKEIIEYHNLHYTIEFKFSQKIYNYIFDISSLPHCIECGNEVGFRTFNKGYGKYCSHNCSYSSKEKHKLISQSHKSRTKEDIEKSNKKREKTCLEMYNSTNVSKSNVVRKKLKEISNNRTEEEKQQSIEKLRNTWKNKTQEELDELVKRRNETNSHKTQEEKDESYRKSIITRIKNCGSLEESYRLGVEKGKKTNNERYGVDNTFQISSVINHTKERNDLYRKEHFKDIIEYIKESDTYICKCMDEKCNLCSCKIFSITTHNYFNRKRCGYADKDICVIKNPIGEYRGRSLLQDDIYEYVKSIYCGKILYNDKSVLKSDCSQKIELDIFIPDLNLAFEVNGDYWHMNPMFYCETDYNEKEGLYAKDIWKRDEFKESICKNMGIELHTIWENDWKNNRDVVQEIINDIIWRKM